MPSKKSSRKGDTVTIVGGGRGISLVVAARQTGENGALIANEGALEMVQWMYRTIAENKVQSFININHGVVGPEKLFLVMKVMSVHVI